MYSVKKTALFLSLSLAAVAAWAGARGAIDPQRYLNDVKYLASPELKGRGDGTPELEKAADYIAKQFRTAGLKPVPGKTYYQAFSVTINAKLGAANQLASSEGGQRTELKLNDDFVPFNFSAKAKLAGPVVFAGYGITAPEYGYDDYSGVDVKGKIVLVLRHEPQEADEKSVFAGRMLTDHANFPRKASNAKAHGAAGVILINDRFNHRGESDQLEQFGRTAGPMDAGIPFVQVKSEVAERWFQAAGKNLEEIQAGIDKDLHGRAFAFPETLRIEGMADVERESKTVHNVAAYLPGETDEYVVIGAHYDHLGLGEQFSMSPSEKGQVHPGADDNASGVAGVLELARWFAARPKPKRGVLFLAFAGEELGLLGSSYYVNDAELPIDKAVAMINLDMIGRIRDDKVYVGGVGTGNTLKPILEDTIPKHQIKVDFSDAAGYGSSDHTSFTTKQVPVLFFFSGLHGDYHRPSDTWDKIDAPAAAKLLGLVGEVSERLVAAEARPQFVRVKPPAGAMGGMAGGGGPGYGASFGSVPDFGFNAKGVKFADVREGTPAAKAGLKGGDVLVEFDGKPIDNLYDFTYALRAHKPGDVVPVKVLRDGKEMKVEVTLEKRR
jgi:hypothetical protein